MSEEVLITVHTKGDHIWTQSQDGRVRAFQVMSDGTLREIETSKALQEGRHL